MLTLGARVITNGRQSTGSRGTCPLLGSGSPRAALPARTPRVSASGGRLPGASVRAELAPGGRLLAAAVCPAIRVGVCVRWASGRWTYE